jgi:hypothetical protein
MVVVVVVMDLVLVVRTEKASAKIKGTNRVLVVVVVYKQDNNSTERATSE